MTAAAPAVSPYRFLEYYVDGGVLGRNPSPRGVYWSMLLDDPAAPVMVRERSAAYHSNNDAEWLALRQALMHATAHHAGARLVIYSDSRLVVRQFNGAWRVKIARHHRLRTECARLAEGFAFVGVTWRPRHVLVRKLGH
jgi:ribonuclease HI